MKSLIAASAAIGLIFGFSVLAAASVKMTGGSFMIARRTVAAAGVRVTSASRALNTTVGENGIVSSAGGLFKLNPGFMNLAAQPGSITALTAVTKSTGTLLLSWTAPGVDGFEGTSAISGHYRLDYSADPNHVFSPTVYQQEISTVVVPGSLQSLQISGLSPNTTYYTRIYLADARKYFAEDSRRSDESTLANVPVNPVLASVFSTSVTISWTLPAGGAQGFEAQGGTTSFSGLLPPGAVIVSSSPSGAVVHLTMDGLLPNTTYFFRVASLNWQGDKNFVTVLAAVTPPNSNPLPVLNLAAAVNALSRKVSVTWTNPVFFNHEGVLVVLSTSATSPAINTGTGFVPGDVFADSAVVKSTALAASFQDSGLTLDTTYFYHLYTQGVNRSYSVSVSTAVFLDIPPMAPAGLTSELSADGSRFTLNWHTVGENMDGSEFSSKSAPREVELSRYDIYRSTAVLRAGWVKITSVPVSAGSYTDTLPNPGQDYLYKVVAVDSFETAETGMAMDTDRNLYVFAKDAVTRLKIPSDLTHELNEGYNPHGDLMIKVEDEPVSAADKVMRAARFNVFKVRKAEPVKNFQFSQPGVEVALHYTKAGDKIVAMGPASVSEPSSSPLGNLSAMRAADYTVSADDEENLGMYWDNGVKYVKIFGKSVPYDENVHVYSSMVGGYQIRSVVRAKAFSFDLSGVSNKTLTPNGDGKNDTVVFSFDNPKDSAFSGQIYDASGAAIAEMTPGPIPNTLQWNGKGNGRFVPGGVYVYQLRGEGKVFNGTLVVIR